MNVFIVAEIRDIINSFVHTTNIYHKLWSQIHLHGINNKSDRLLYIHIILTQTNFMQTQSIHQFIINTKWIPEWGVHQSTLIKYHLHHTYTLDMDTHLKHIMQIIKWRDYLYDVVVDLTSCFLWYLLIGFAWKMYFDVRTWILRNKIKSSDLKVFAVEDLIKIQLHLYTFWVASLVNFLNLKLGAQFNSNFE